MKNHLYVIPILVLAAWLLNVAFGEWRSKRFRFGKQRARLRLNDLKAELESDAGRLNAVEIMMKIEELNARHGLLNEAEMEAIRVNAIKSASNWLESHPTAVRHQSATLLELKEALKKPKAA